MAVTYGTTAEYGTLDYKQDYLLTDDNNDYLKMIIDLWPLQDLLVERDA